MDNRTWYARVDYYANHKDSINESCRIYYHNNKEKIAKNQKEKITCQCGATIQKKYIRKHQTSRNHLSFLWRKLLKPPKLFIKRELKNI